MSAVRRLPALCPDYGSADPALPQLYPGGGPLRFESTKQAVALAGLDPRQHQSSFSVRGKPRLFKVGHAHRPGAGRKQRLAAAGKPAMLMLGAMMQKLLCVAYGVRRSGPPFDPALHQLA